MENKYFKRIDESGICFCKFEKKLENDDDLDSSAFKGIVIKLARNGGVKIAREKIYYVFPDEFKEISDYEFYAFLEFATSIINEDNDQ